MANERSRLSSGTGSRFALALAILVSVSLPVRAGSARDEAVEELLRLHHEQRVAHVLADAALLTSPFAADFVEMSLGRMSTPTADQARARFDSYLNSVHFLEWENTRPPVIRLSPDGKWAEMLVSKRVRALPADPEATPSEVSMTFAWSERWSRTDDGWKLSTIVSTDRPSAGTSDASPADRLQAHRILTRAREALGGLDAVARVATLSFTSECSGPNGEFRTEVASARDGRAKFVQRFADDSGFAAGRDLEGQWVESGGGPADRTPNAVIETVVSGHEMHLLALAPESRFSSPVARPEQSLQGRQVHVVELTDSLGAAVSFYFDPETHLPVGFSPANHTGRGSSDILTTFAGWRRVGEVLLPFSIRIEHGEDLYAYRITEASVAWLNRSAFQPAAE